MLKGEVRRTEILNQLQTHDQAISASQLAKEFGVSRQIIVGDVALLRASGTDILATGKGYLLKREEKGILKKIACQHTLAQTKDELEIIVKNGGEIIDVLVEHPLYGELKGGLYIKTLQDIHNFLEDIKKPQILLLSSLTNGIHLHTILVPSEVEFAKIHQQLKEAGILYQNEN